jgi:hypothetical protein
MFFRFDEIDDNDTCNVQLNTQFSINKYFNFVNDNIRDIYFHEIPYNLIPVDTHQTMEHLLNEPC